MRVIALAAVVALSAGLGTAWPAWSQGRHDDRPHGVPTAAKAPTKVPDGAIPLKDGGHLLIGRDGITYHVDRDGKRVRMRDGQVMEATDGAKYLMRNDAIWRTITDKGTMHPGHP